MSIIHFLISFALAYIIGATPVGYWIGRVFFKKNLLEMGSGNIGTTNTFRNLGALAGTSVMVLDILKGSFGAMMALLWGPLPAGESWWFFAVGLGAILGHTYSFWIGFKGGKAVATSVGVLLMYNPGMFAFACFIFVLGIFITSTVSIASMAGFLIVTIASMIISDWILFIIALSLTIFVFYRHRENIKRIMNGTESKIPFGLVYWTSKK
jgi:glycerol-3-phosphate acyltransferase PlsY